MFRWYHDAAKCYVYLPDVSISDEQSFHTSRWFTRGWTLQELLAPRVVEFFSIEEQRLGDRISRTEHICSITGISATALQERCDLTTFTVDERLSWAKNRSTKRSEDAAYSLLGLFGIYIPLIYGEGRERAFARLHREIELNSRNPPKRVIFNTPFRRDVDFINRGTILEELDKSASEPASSVALFGLGGVGKSQLAIEYSYRVHESSPQTSVFWVHAGTQGRFEEGYRRIAEMTQMNGWDNPKIDTLQLVYNWLCDTNNGQWMLVVDNADDETVFLDRGSQGHAVDQPTKPLSDFIPQSKNGKIFITSRNRDLAYKLTGSYRSITEVKPMDVNDALCLFEKKLGPEVSRENAAELLEAFDYMPLAITQAAAYIRQRAPRMSVKRYLDEFRKSERDQGRLLKDLSDPRRDSRASNSIITTWRTSFEHIQAHMPTAARLLSLMCLFGRQGIPETLLDGHYAGEEDDVDFEDDIQILISYSLIATGAEGSLEMHRLVQVSTRKWLEVNNALEGWKETYIRLIGTEFDKKYNDDWRACQSVLPQIQSAIDCRPYHPTSLELWASLVKKASVFLYRIGQYTMSERMGLISLETRRNLLGTDHLDTIDSMNRLAITFHAQGRYEAAEPMWKSVAAIRERLLGREAHGTLTVLGNLAAVYRDLGRWSETEKLGLEVMQTRKRMFGEESLATQKSITHQAILYCLQGRFKKAEKLAVELVEVGTRVHGPKYHDTIHSKGVLADVYRGLGRLEEAEELYLEVLESKKTSLGSDHPITITIMGKIAQLYYDQERWE
jgi:tetratricopeptide (TPR) repeat protein